ncbi:MAG: dipeptidase [Clostridia bacterium]|nr:dipeptidase [Clostridia bacterium]
MYVADMHCDSLSLVSGERGLVSGYNRSKKHPHLQFFAHFEAARDTDAAERRRRLMRNFNVYLSECQRLGMPNVISNRELFSAADGGSSAAMFTVEGGGGLFADSPELDVLYRGGLSVLGLAWDRNELSSSAWDAVDEGLTEEGVRMVERCAELGITVDTSHLSDRAFFEVFECSPYPHIATHSNFRSICPSPRNLTDEMAKMIAARGGVIGLNIYPPFLREGGNATLDDVIRHVDYALALVGDSALGFGFDIDGTEGCYPVGISESESIHDRVIEELEKRYGTATVEKIAGGNVIDFLKNNLA